MAMISFRVGILALFSLFCCQGHLLLAQTAPELKFRHYDMSHGLVHNMARQMVMDKDGFLWIITQGGISVFDGVHFQSFNNKENAHVVLPFIDLSDVVYDGDRTMWFSGEGGVFGMDIKTKQVIIPVSPSLKTFVRSITLHNGILYAAAEIPKKIYSYDIKKNLLDSFSQSYMNWMPDMIVHNEKLFIAVEREKLVSIDLKTKKEKRYEGLNWPFRFSVIDGQLYVCFWQNPIGKYLAEKDTLLPMDFKFAMDNGVLQYFTQLGITTTEVLPKGLALVLSHIDGLTAYDLQNQKIVRRYREDKNKQYSIGSNFCNNIYKDQFNNIWIATWHGISVINPREQQFQSEVLPLLKTTNYNLLSGIDRDKIRPEIIWVASNGDGILKINTSKQTLEAKYFSQFEGDTDPYYDHRWTEFLKVDAKNRVWGGGYAGLTAVINGKAVTYDFDRENGFIFVRNMCILEGRDYWVATSKGLVRFNPEQETYKLINKTTHPVLPWGSDNLADVLQMPGKKLQLLVIRRDGLCFLDPLTEQFTEIPIHGIEAEARLVAGAVDAQGQIYIGTKRGIYLLKKGSDKWIKVSSLTPNYFNTMQTDAAGNCWVYNKWCLLRIEAGTARCTEFNPANGIWHNSDDPGALFSFEGNLYLGYRMAMTRFNPLSIKPNVMPAVPAIRNIELSNGKHIGDATSYLSNQYLKIPYSENYISISLSAINYTFAEKNTYRYRLEEEWKTLDISGRLTLTGLAPGKYQLEIMAVNSAGVANPKTITLHFQIVPVFWQTWWFALLVLASLAGIAYLVYKARKQSQEETEALRRKLSGELHDEIGSTLTSIRIAGEMLQRQPNGERESLLQIINSESKKATESLSDIVWNINPQNENWQVWAARVRQSVATLFDSGQMAYAVLVKGEDQALPTSLPLMRHLYLSIKEMCNNIVKHSGADTARVNIEFEKRWVCINVSDNGKGLPADALTRGNGLRMLKQRADSMGWELQIDGQEASGTTIRMKVPLK